jgi:outer membrane protein assembly factor BamA
MRGYLFNTVFGNYFALTNVEFRFPLVAALLPGPIPLLPLYNLTGLLFVDAGFAWGIDVGLNDDPQFTNPASLDFSISRARVVSVGESGNIYEEGDIIPDGERVVDEVVREGDVLIGMGYGLRTILLGLPFRFDVGFPFDGRSFGNPIYYFSLGVDF